MKIEVLFPEICNLYGDLANIRYLKECLPDAEVLETSLQTRPRFIDEDIDLVYMGTTTEQGQILALEQLRFYRDDILKRVDDGGRFLITGNAMELFGERIEEDGEEVCRGLGLFPGVARRSSVNRFNSLFVGEFRPAGFEEEFEGGSTADAPEAGASAADAPAAGASTDNGPAAGASESGSSTVDTPTDNGPAAGDPITVVGFKSQFGHMFTDEGDHALNHLALFKAVRGPGMNRYAKGEGIRLGNFLATYVIGPLLILNPPFTKWFIRDFLEEPLETLAFEEAAMDSYNTRVEEYNDPNTGLYYWGGTNERW